MVFTQNGYFWKEILVYFLEMNRLNGNFVDFNLKTLSRQVSVQLLFQFIQYSMCCVTLFYVFYNFNCIIYLMILLGLITMMSGWMMNWCVDDDKFFSAYTGIIFEAKNSIAWHFLYQHKISKVIYCYYFCVCVRIINPKGIILMQFHCRTLMRLFVRMPRIDRVRYSRN